MKDGTAKLDTPVELYSCHILPIINAKWIENIEHVIGLPDLHIPFTPDTTDQ
jgi:hypothetical protein